MSASDQVFTAIPGVKLTPHPMNRIWIWSQLAVAYLLLEASLWTEGRTQHMFALATAVWIVIATLLSRRPLRELGLGTAGFAKSLIAIPVALAAAAMIVIIGWHAGTLRGLFGARPPLWHSSGYAIWALMQQFILNSFFYQNLEELLGDGKRALWGAAALFCFAHIPNPVLMAGTLAAALFFVTVFQRFRNIYPLGLAHAMLGLSLAVTVPDAWIRHMRVGISYLHFVVR
jgi:CAAX prenyl protease-like protein